MEEEILIEQLKAGNREAFDVLYEKYKNMAIRTAYLITGNLSESEDVVQEAFLKVWLYRGQLQHIGGFRAWMMKILARTAYRAAKKRRREFPDEEAVNRMEDRTDSSSLDKVMQLEEAKRLYGVVRALPVRLRTVVILYYYDGLGIREIAKMLGIMEGTVKSRLYTARKRMERALEPE